jgi:hypothetical protein
MTRNGIFYDLHKSSFRYTQNKIVFVFSSQTHLFKFKERLHQNRIKVNNSLSSRFGITCSFDVLADLVLYQQIEKRGFLVYNERGDELCKEKVQLNGDKLTMTE